MKLMTEIAKTFLQITYTDLLRKTLKKPDGGIIMEYANINTDDIDKFLNGMESNLDLDIDIDDNAPVLSSEDLSLLADFEPDYNFKANNEHLHSYGV